MVTGGNFFIFQMFESVSMRELDLPEHSHVDEYGPTLGFSGMDREENSEMNCEDDSMDRDSLSDREAGRKDEGVGSASSNRLPPTFRKVFLVIKDKTPPFEEDSLMPGADTIEDISTTDASDTQSSTTDDSNF